MNQIIVHSLMERRVAVLFYNEIPSHEQFITNEETRGIQQINYFYSINCIDCTPANHYLELMLKILLM
jgi:hypothetical protein